MSSHSQTDTTTTSQAHDDLPHKFGIVLYPGFQDIDAFGPIDVFNGISWFLPDMELYFLGHKKEPISTKVPPAVGPPSTYGFSIQSTLDIRMWSGGRWTFLNREYSYIESYLTVTPTHTFCEPPELDVLLVPGGKGAWAGDHDVNLEAVRDFVLKTYKHGKIRYLLTVCTGAATIAPTGILDGKKATTNKMSWKWAVSQGKKVHWQPRARWTQDGNIWISSGVTAGIDMAFAWAAHVYNGKIKVDGKVVNDIAQDVADIMEYNRAMDPNDDPFCKKWGVCKDKEEEKEVRDLEK